jgi:D-glycero-alpha-D-manno-heptose-7-phosphate kinase
MIISQTPLRISFAGGGSDLPSYYEKYGGAVVSSAIDKFVYVTVSQKFDAMLRVSYSRTEEVERASEVKHPIVREGLSMLGIEGGLEITSVADIPSRGTGLGSSSSFSVGLLHALHATQGRYVSAERLADEACEIEISRCGEPIGKQDQYAAAYGGLNFIEFLRDGSVRVEPIALPRETRNRLEQRFLVFYTGITRSASEILLVQSNSLKNDLDKSRAMSRMVDYARELRDELWGGNIDAMGRILHENWLLKQSLSSGISSTQINDWYAAAMNAGALGGKLLGAGGGGFLLFYAPEERHAAICAALRELRRIETHLEPRGSRILFVNR